MSLTVKTLNYVDYFGEFEDEVVNRIKESFSWFDESNDDHGFYIRRAIREFCLGECCENNSYTPLDFLGFGQDLDFWDETDVIRMFGDTPFTLEQLVAVYKEVIVPLLKEAGFEDTATFWAFW